MSEKRMEVRATHITTQSDPSRRRLVCELYPGILVIDGHPGPTSVITFGNRVAPLHPGSDRPFPIFEFTADLAAEMYEESVEQAALLRENDHLAGRAPSVWPPREWVASNKHFFDNPDQK
ncbi:hypothetical protein [Rhodococcus sp. NPDC049939]|uniref:hypothetical protein n=1 Tax=Rhodococcus sp. NPDC049939 TaxID=3155511 RepID=UPI0033D486A9